MYTEMPGTDPHLVATAFAAGLAVLALLGSAFTWSTSRAKKVRLLEDGVLEAVRVQRARADQVETKLAEWQTTIQGVLAEVEEFFERTVRERKRIVQRQAREENNGPQAPPFETMTREQQKEAVRLHFAGQQ